MDELLTIDEVAAKLKVKPRTVREWLQTGRLRGIRAGRLWRMRAEDVEAFLEASTKAHRRVVEPERSDADAPE
jgi:excisionase family DNA binding protein